MIDTTIRSRDDRSPCRAACPGPLPGRRARASARLLFALVALAFAPVALSQPGGWFVSFVGNDVAPTARDDVSQLFDAGTIETDGFSELVFSLGGEFKGGLPSSGTLGAVLIPDIEQFQYLLRNEGQFVFPLEVRYNVGEMRGAIFISEQQRAKIAFPRYRVYLYNETSSLAKVSLFVYRTR